jgi:hypothetical protein
LSSDKVIPDAKIGLENCGEKIGLFDLAKGHMHINLRNSREDGSITP